MFPILLRVGSVSVHTYGVAMALAFLVSIFIIGYEAKRKGFESSLAYDIVLFAMVGGIVGARLLYVIDNWHELIASPIQIFAVWQGGLEFQGGLIGGALSVYLLTRLRKISVGKVADMAAPALALGTAIGRLGCFANGCCSGKETALPWAVTFTNKLSSATYLGVPVHPTQLYEFTYNIIILGILWWARDKLKSNGLLFWIYITLYGFFRFLVEFVRTDPVRALGMSASQIFSLVMMMAGLAVIFGYYFRSSKPEVEQANQQE